MQRNDVDFLVLSEAISSLLAEKKNILIAIDGRCASGKTTLAKALFERCDCNIFHMDDFFLRPEQRTEARLSEAGGNVDRERFEREVLLPLKKGEPFSFCPYDCGTASLGKPIAVTPKRISVIEGSYSCHPALFDYYDLRIFLTVNEKEQMRRIQIRNGMEKAEIFRTRWIPMEEKYFSVFSVKNKCDLVIET